MPLPVLKKNTDGLTLDAFKEPAILAGEADDNRIGNVGESSQAAKSHSRHESIRCFAVSIAIEPKPPTERFFLRTTDRFGNHGNLRLVDRVVEHLQPISSHTAPQKKRADAGYP